MKAKTKLTRLWGFLLALVMIVGMLPTTAFAAGNPDPTAVFVDGGKSFYNNRLYYKKGDQDKNFTGNEGDYIAHYNPATGTLTLNGYSGGSISVGGVKCSDITVVLKGTNTINGSLENAVGGDITVTSSDGGTLSISKTTSGSNSAIGIETGLSASYTTGNVTIKGNAKVTINMTHNGTSTYEKAYGIFAKENIAISENASVDITCATPNNTTGGGNCNGLYAAKDVTIDTNGTIKIDVTNAGKDKDNGYSYGVYHMGTATLTKVGNMEVQWKKEGNSTRYSGGAFIKGATFSDTDHAINEDTTNCYASYRFGTPRKVTAGNGQLTGPGVKYANNSGYFLAGDKVNIKPNEKKSSDGTLIPFKEWTFSDVMLDKSATTASNSFTVPGKDVTVTATYNPFDGAPVFTRTSDSSGTIAFKTAVKPDNSEFFEYVKDGETTYNGLYPQPTTTSSASPYEYSVSASTYYVGDIKYLEAGDYRMAVTLNGERYLSEKFTVNYTAPVTTYTVSFNANGGTGTMADVTDISGEYTLPANGFTAPAGKQFKAWSVGGVEKAVGDKITVTANTTITAVWEDIPVVTYTVSFDANGGTGTMADVTDVSGEYTLPANGFTAPAGKQFKAWSVGGVEKAVGDKITVTANTTVTAVWEDIPVVTYTVSFDANGGTGTMADVTDVSGEYTLPANGFTAPAGKQFKAWSVGGVEKAVGDKITVTANTTVTAVWEAIEYNVTVTGGTASVGAGTPITKATMGTTVTLTAGAAPTGQMFDKWVVNGVVVDDANSATTTFVMPAGNVTAEATYKNIPVVTYTVSFDANGGTGTMADVTDISGEYTLPENGFTAPAGKQFKAWSVGGVEKAVGDKITVTANTTVTAVWEAIEYNVTVTGGTASVGAGTPITKATMGTTVTLTAGAAPSGQMFDKWVVNGVVVDDANSATTTFVMPAGNVTAEATYKNIPVVTYTVSFDANGGTGSMADATGVSGEYTLPANGFTAPDGKQFKAWSVGGVEKAAGDKITVTANTTVTAVWEDIPVVTYTVSFDANGGTGTMTDVTGVSGEYTLPANGFTAPDGKQFKAWSVGGVEKAVGDKITVTANTTVTAVWENIPVTYYTVTFDSNGGSAVTAQSIEAGQKATKPADPTKDGYDFKGWTLNGSAYDFNTAVNGNITLVATWEQQQVVPTTYTVSFAANGGTGTMADVTGISGEYTLPENGFTAPDGKQFKAWSVDGNEKAVGDKITVTADTTVTAVWETIPAGHTCDIKPVAKVEPSCTEGGKEAYYKCEGCGKFYEDALGTKEITDLASWGNLAKLGHTESDWKSDKDNHWKECTVAGCGVIIENSKAAHADANNDGKCDTCEYNVGIPTTPGGDKPNDNPQTGDNSMMWLWIALLFVSGFGVVTTTVYTKKRKSVK